MAVSNDEKFEYCSENADAEALERIKSGECSVDDVYKTLVGQSEMGESNGDVLPERVSVDEKGQYRIEADTFADWFKKKCNFFFIKTNNSNALKFIYDSRGVYYEVSDDIFKGKIKDALPQKLRKANTIEEVFRLIKMDENKYVDIHTV